MNNTPPKAGSDWQAITLTDLKSKLEANDEVLALGVFGSMAQGVSDFWSDIDLIVVVADEAKERFYPTLDWLKTVGEIYA